MIKFLQHFPLAKTFIREMTEVNPNANFANLLDLKSEPVYVNIVLRSLESTEKKQVSKGL